MRDGDRAAPALRVAHVLYSFGTGGLEKGIATVARNGTTDTEHVIVCMTDTGVSERMLPANARVVALGKPPGQSFRFLWTLRNALRRIRPDVVHTRNWVGMDGIVAARLAGIRGIVHGEHGWGMDDPDGMSPRRIRVRRFLSRWVREFTCVSQQMATWLRDDVGIRGTITQIYNGVDSDRYAPAPSGPDIRDSLGVPRDAFVIGTVGRLDPIKNQVGLVDTFRGLIESRPDAVLLIVGEGSERDRIQSASAASGDSIRLLGDRSDVAELYRAMDTFVLPSFNEGISNTILEAMASGLPVVACDVGGNPELVEDEVTGVLVPVRDPGALRTALAGYHDDPVRRRAHGDAGRAAVRKRFDDSAMTSAYEAVWRRVAAGARGARDAG